MEQGGRNKVEGINIYIFYLYTFTFSEEKLNRLILGLNVFILEHLVHFGILTNDQMIISLDFDSISKLVFLVQRLHDTLVVVDKNSSVLH